MLEILLASLPTFLPQDPPVDPTAALSSDTARTPAAATRHAPSSSPDDWLPDNTLAALVLAPLQSGSPAAELLGSADGRNLLEMVSALMQPALTTAQLSKDDALAMLRGGIALGLVGFDGGMRPDVVLVAGVGDAEIALAARLAKLDSRSDGLRVVGTGSSRLFVGLRQGHLAAGTNAATVAAALRQSLDGGEPSLSQSQDYARSLPVGGGQLLSHVFVRIGDLVTAAFDAMPETEASIASRIGEVLGASDMRWASATWQLIDTDLVVNWQLEAPHGQGLLLDALAGTQGRLDASLARFVPKDAKGCGFFAVRFGTVFDELLALVNMANPDATAMLDQGLERLRDQTGIDVRADVIGGLGERVLAFALPGDGLQFGVLIELRQGTAFTRTLGKLLPSLPIPLEAGNSAGAKCWRMRGNDNGPALAIADDWLLLASSDAALAQTARQVREPKADPRIVAFLRSLPADATAATVGPVAVLPGPWFTGTNPADDLGDLGQRRVVVRRTPDGFLAEERAPARPLLRVASAMLHSVVDPMGLATAASSASSTNSGDTSDDAAAAATLRAVAKETATRSNVTALAALLSHRDPAVVARACWQLGEWQAREALPMLADLVRDHADARVRLQAVTAIARIDANADTETLVLATDDQDPRVRLTAVQALGKLGPAQATAPMLALLDRLGSERPNAASLQVLVAALVALHDLGDPQNLVPAAAAIGFAEQHTGQALAFLFQDLSPRLPSKGEASALLAVLDHPEPMLRRYAIQRLGELRDPSTAKALEGRLTQEGPDLQPLVRVSLTQVRGETDEGADDLVTRAKSNVTAISQMVERRWNRLGANAKVATGGAAGVMLLALIGILMARRRARRNAAAAEALAMVGPSAGYAASGRDEQQEYYEDEPADEFVGIGGETDEHY